MKLRIRGNSLRLRLTRSELDTLSSTGRIAETTEFPRQPPLVYALTVSPSQTALSASFDRGEICVSIPEEAFRHWLQPQEVGISGTQALEGGKILSLLIEKDFPCLTPRVGEDDSDAFARPDGGPDHCAPEQ